MRNIWSINEVQQYFKSVGPVTQSDFYIEVKTQDAFSKNAGDALPWYKRFSFNAGILNPTWKVIGTLPNFVCVGFTVPEFGISFTPSSEFLTYSQPNLSVSALQISYLIRNDNSFNEDAFKILYDEQFNSSGTLKVIPETSRPNITFNIRQKQAVYCMVSFEGCRFSYPKPTVDLASVDKSVFTTTVSYSNYIVHGSNTDNP